MSDQRNVFYLIKGLFRFLNSFPVVGVDGVDDAVTLGVVLVPQGLQLLLTAQVPEVQPKNKYFQIYLAVGSRFLALSR